MINEFYLKTTFKNAAITVLGQGLWVALFVIGRFKLFSCPFRLLFLAPFTLATFRISYPFWVFQKVGC